MYTFPTGALLLLVAWAAVPVSAQAPTTDVQREEANAALSSTQRALAAASVDAAQKAVDRARVQLAALPPPPPAPVIVTPPQPPSETTTVLEQVRDAVLPVFMLGLLAFLGIVAKNIPAATTALDSWMQLQLTKHQQDRVAAATRTAAWRIETRLDQGTLQVADVTENNAEVRRIVSDALIPVKESAAAQGVTVDTAAGVVVGKVDTSRIAVPVAKST